MALVFHAECAVLVLCAMPCVMRVVCSGCCVVCAMQCVLCGMCCTVCAMFTGRRVLCTLGIMMYALSTLKKRLLPLGRRGGNLKCEYSRGERQMHLLDRCDEVERSESVSTPSRQSEPSDRVTPGTGRVVCVEVTPPRAAQRGRTPCVEVTPPRAESEMRGRKPGNPGFNDSDFMPRETLPQDSKRARCSPGLAAQPNITLRATLVTPPEQAYLITPQQPQLGYRTIPSAALYYHILSSTSCRYRNGVWNR